MQTLSNDYVTNVVAKALNELKLNTDNIVAFRLVRHPKQRNGKAEGISPIYNLYHKTEAPADVKFGDMVGNVYEDFELWEGGIRLEQTNYWGERHDLQTWSMSVR